MFKYANGWYRRDLGVSHKPSGEVYLRFNELSSTMGVCRVSPMSAAEAFNSQVSLWPPSLISLLHGHSVCEDSLQIYTCAIFLLFLMMDLSKLEGMFSDLERCLYPSSDVYLVILSWRVLLS